MNCAIYWILKASAMAKYYNFKAYVICWKNIKTVMKQVEILADISLSARRKEDLERAQ
jgi:hypothetical protein